ncbi:hypothetical protein BDQ17DRAFT_1412716 [Cyathus striatus]|nr:hypothetical protein BDQ17DRAFT_1412716 [Cyathus striatus]
MEGIVHYLTDSPSRYITLSTSIHTFITRKLTYLSITLTILDSIIVSRIVWHQFAEGWGIEEIFIKQTVVGRTPPVFIGLIALIAQCFFAWRNWRDNSYHSKRFHTAVSITIALLSVIQCTGALATVAFDIGFPPLAHTTLAYRASMGIWLTASLLCNFAINLTSRTKASKQYEWLFGLALSVVHFAMYYKWQAQNWYIAFSYALFGGYVNLLAITLIRETRPNSDLPVANPYPRDTRPPLHLSAGAEESFRLKNLRQGSKVPMIEIIKNVR